jgi:hypothetical protein
MLKKAALFAVLFSFVLPVLSQNELNAYKYIIIPKKYDFLKTENQYRLNSLTKHNFDKLGYMTLIQGEALPEEVKLNPCMAATANVINESNAFTTKLTLTLSNCFDQVIFTSIQGTSKIKEFDQTYKDALEKCFVSIEELNYQFDDSLLISNNDQPKNTIAVLPVKTGEQNLVKTAAVVAVVEKPKALPEPEQSKKVIPAAMAAAALAIGQEQPEKTVNEALSAVTAKSYKNESLTFFLIEQKGKLVAYVTESKNGYYKKGEVIGEFEKTSLAGVYRVNWKKEDQATDETIAYFDDAGNLKVDVHRNGKIELLTFLEEK